MNNTTLLFIDEGYIREVFPLDSNIDSKFITPAIMMSQENQVKQYIGTAMYNKLTNLLTTGAITADTNWSDFYLNYEKKMHAYFAMYLMVDMLNYRMTNKGIQVMHSDTSQPANTKELGIFKESIDSYGKYFAERLTWYLMARPQIFPEYVSATLNNNYPFDTVFPNRRYSMPGGVLIPNIAKRKPSFIGFDNPELYWTHR